MIINGQFWGVTPIVANLDRNDRYNIAIELEGYYPFETMIVSQRDMAMAGNCLVGGLPGVAVDSMSGAAFVLKPEMVHTVLVIQGERLPPITRSQPQYPVRTPVVRKQQQKSDESEAIVVILFVTILILGFFVVSGS